VRPLLDHAPGHVQELSADAIFDRAQVRRIEQELPYAGAVTPVEAWRLVSLGAAKIIDVRTPPEFKFVGSVPDTPNVEWRGHDLLPSAMFIDGLRRVAGASEAVLLLCRSGVRSHAAARAATEAGFRRVYNVLEGFEGQRNDAGHRSEVDGWRRHGLPWIQD
jgi:rhodanese-related sulfurtransferase